MGSTTKPIHYDGATDVEYHEPSRSFRTSFRDERRSALDAITSAVAAATDRDPLALPVLYTTIDPDALDELVNPVITDPSQPDVTVRFAYADCLVEVNSRGVVSATVASNH